MLSSKNFFNVSFFPRLLSCPAIPGSNELMPNNPLSLPLSTAVTAVTSRAHSNVYQCVCNSCQFFAIALFAKAPVSLA